MMKSIKKLLSVLLVLATLLTGTVFVVSADGGEAQAASDSYAYPISDAELGGYFEYWNSSDVTFKAYAGEYGMIYIDLTALSYKYVTFVVGENDSGYLGYGFLKAQPVVGEAVQYAEGTKFNDKEGLRAGAEITAEIPTDAVCLAVWVEDKPAKTQYPASITFANEKKVPELEDIYVYASSQAELVEKNPITEWCFNEDGDNTKWLAEDPDPSGRAARYLFIDISELDYDTAAIGIGSSSNNRLRYAFLTALPTADGEDAAFVEGTGVNNFNTSTSSSIKNKLKGKLWFIDIPEGTKYLALLATFWSDEPNVAPYSVTFMNTNKNLLDNTLSTYSYPMSSILPAAGSIDADGNYVIESSGKTNTALINIAGTVFDTVTLQPKDGDTTVEYSFLTEVGYYWEPISTADGTTKMQTANAGDAIAIPANAKYLAIRYNENGENVAPSAITFNNTDATVEAPVDIEMLAGAEARIAAKSGLRFTTRIPTAQLEALAAAGTEYTVGTLIYPTDMLDGALTVETEGALNLTGATPMVDAEEAGYTYFYAAIVDILAQNYARAFSAVSYIKIGDDYYYTDYSEENNSRSIYEVAYAANAAAPSADLQFFFNGIVEIKDGAVVTPAGYTSAFAAAVVDDYIVIEKGANNWADLHAVIVDGVVYTSGWADAGEEFMTQLPTNG